MLTRAVGGQGYGEAMPLSYGEAVSTVSGSGSRCGWHSLPMVVNNHDMRVVLSHELQQKGERQKLWSWWLTGGDRCPSARCGSR